MQAVILAGGFGTSLSHILNDVPKPMMPIQGIPFLAYQIDLLRENGFDSVIILSGYLSEIIEQYFAGILDISIIKETKPLGTGGALLNAYPHLDNEFFVISGDIFFDIDFSLLADFAHDKKSVMALRFSEEIARYRLINITSDFLISNFEENTTFPPNVIDGYINSGIYYFKKQALAPFYKRFNSNFLSIKKDFFPALSKCGDLHGLPCGGFFIDLNIPKDNERAKTLIPELLKQPKRPAVFVDKDGTLIKNTGYPHGVHITIIESTLKQLQEYQKNGYLIIMVTNQSGIARGKFSLEAMYENIDAIQQHYAKHNIFFDAVQYCPYYPEGTVTQYRFISKKRKPEPGMLLSACEICRIDMKHSLMLGDNHAVDIINLPYLKTILIEG